MARMNLVGRRSLAVGMGAVLATVLLVLSLPRTLAALVTIPSALVLERLQHQQPVTFADLETVAAAQARGLLFVNDGRLSTDLGLAHLLMAERLPADEPRVGNDLALAVQALTDGLVVAPGNPYAWARLSYAEARKRGWSPLALSALRLALLTASYEPRLLWSRLRLSLLAWPHMPPEDREIVYQQIRIGWGENRVEMAQLANDLDRVNVVRAALLRDSEAAAEFEKMVRPQAR